MRVPVAWLRDFVEFDATTRELADKLTFAGLEVETIETVGSECRGVVVAEIKAVGPHPNAGNLLLCRVNTGAGEVQVVCGARNFKVGDKVPYACAGTVLPNGTKIEETAIRGEKSAGMLCAEDELGVSDDHSGLMLLSADLAPGTPFSRAVPPEPVLVIEVTPNRSDCLSIIGIAREVAALYGTALKTPSLEYPESGQPIEQSATVVVRDQLRCPRYTARVLTGVVIGPSPLWMRMRLIQGGIRPISNVVDITNYVMLEYGQPLHAFDKALLKDGRIVVRRAGAGETMATLDGTERRITKDMLVIADAQKPVAVAGVMGGAGSEIRADTREVLLESACFQAAGIRRTAKALGLSTESSYRFERGVDPNLADVASRRAAQLMIRHAGAAAMRGVIDIFPKNPRERVIPCRYEKVRGLTGVDFKGEQIASILKSLQFTVEKQTRNSCSVRVPSFRGDIEIWADLVEEIARIHGLDNIPARAPRCESAALPDDAVARATEACRNTLVGLGLSEIVNYSFVSERLLDTFNPADSAVRIVLPNPVSADQSVLRTSLIPQMVSTLGYNLARQAGEAALFEIGRVFSRDSSGKLGEEDRLAIGLMGPVGRPGLDKRSPVEADEVFLWAKGVIEALGNRMHVPGLSMDAVSAPWAEDGKAVGISCHVRGRMEQVGTMGVVKGSIRSEWRMSRPVAVLEVKLAPVTADVFAVPSATTPAQHPSVTRDVAIIVDVSVRHDDVMRILLKNAPPELTHIELFDIYTGKGIAAGRKSLAYSLTYRSLERTLTDEEANRLHEKVKAGMVSELKAEVREG